MAAAMMNVMAITVSGTMGTVAIEPSDVLKTCSANNVGLNETHITA